MLPPAIFLLIASLLGQAGDTARPFPRRELKVLFIGNSFTDYNELPAIVQRLAASSRVDLEYEKSTVGGATLAQHWASGRALRAIREGKFDFVVLQEQSLQPIQDKASMFRHARLFDAEIRRAGAKTVCYMTWSLKSSPKDQAKIAAAYRELGAELGAIVVPVGLAWEAARGIAGSPDLYDSDGKHPSPAGSYLAACLFYRALIGERCVGLPARIDWHGKRLVALADEPARLLQKVADSTALGTSDRAR